jgi:hypothetical protein
MVHIKTLDISFCGKRALNIVNSEAKDEVMKFFKTHSIQINQRYANLLQSSSLNYLSKHPHLISIKTAGTNYFMLLTCLNDTPVTLFIDRKIKSGYMYPRIISSRLGFDESLYHKGTLIDGELVKDNDNNWMFLLHDLLVLDGKKMETTIVHKTNEMYKILSEKFTPNPDFDNCPLRIKKLFAYSDYNKMITQFIPRLKYPIRGMYFNTMSNTHSNFLFLYPNQNTMHGGLMKQDKKNIDSKKDTLKMNENVFTVKQTDTTGVYTLDTTSGESRGEAHVPNLKMSKVLRRALEDNENVRFHCIKNEKFDKWELKELMS